MKIMPLVAPTDQLKLDRAELSVAARCGNNLNFNNSNNIDTLLTVYHFYKTRCGPTNRQTDIATYRAAIAAKNANWHLIIMCKVLREQRLVPYA